MNILSQTDICIKDLPEGQHRRVLMPRVADTRAKVNVVLVEMFGELNAYAGYPNLTALKEQFRDDVDMQYNCAMIHTHQQIAKMGNKLSGNEAKRLFPHYADRIR